MGHNITRITTMPTPLITTIVITTGALNHAVTPRVIATGNMKKDSLINAGLATLILGTPLVGITLGTHLSRRDIIKETSTQSENQINGYYMTERTNGSVEVTSLPAIPALYQWRDENGDGKVDKMRIGIVVRGGSFIMERVPTEHEEKKFEDITRDFYHKSQ